MIFGYEILYVSDFVPLIIRLKANVLGLKVIYTYLINYADAMRKTTEEETI